MLNPVSILAVTVLSGVMAMAVLGSLLPASIPGVGYWVVANALAVISLLCFASQGHISPALSIVVANVLFAIAILMGLQGFLRFFGRPARVPAGYAGVVAVLVGMVYWTFVSPDFNLRVALVSAFHAGVYAAIAAVVFRARPAGRPRYSYHFVAVASALLCIGHVTRGAVYALGLIPQTALLQALPVSIGFLALGILALPSLSIGMVMLAHDRLAERLERLASLDDLTGALARREFIARAEARLKGAARTGTPISLAIIDIDRFKAINDKHGHAAGDQVLMHFASTVTANLRADDIFGRLGGEEFGVICPATTAQEAVAVLNRLRARLAASGYPEPSGATLNYTFSVGVDRHRAGEPLSSLMARADAALYIAKASGRDRVAEAV